MYPIVSTILAILAILAVILGVGLGLALALPSARDRVAGALLGQERHPIAWACAVALIAMGGSLYFSDVVHLVPCTLCWYQRIAMYPLVLVFGVGAMRDDPGVWRYSLPLSVVGLVISIYHVTIELRPALDVGMCTSGVPCSLRYFAVFGFVSIATMAGAAFLLIVALSLLIRRIERST